MEKYVLFGFIEVILEQNFNKIVERILRIFLFLMGVTSKLNYGGGEYVMSFQNPLFWTRGTSKRKYRQKPRHRFLIPSLNSHTTT